MNSDYSVLMSVYYKEKPEFLRTAMMSIYEQTVKTNDFVLVCDGSLTQELDQVIAQMQIIFGSVLNVVRLDQNSGLGKALDTGISHCKNELIARMDSDDISCLNRCEKQLQIFENMPVIAVCSGTVEEFAENPENTDVKRVLPEHPDEIREFAKQRNPFNHPCVMYRKSAVEAVGGYQDFYLLEDYYLWLRMLMKEMKGYNIPDTLLFMRAGAGMYKRRAGWKYARTQQKLFAFMKREGFITGTQFLKSVVLRTGSSLAPNSLRRFMFKKHLRK